MYRYILAPLCDRMFSFWVDEKLKVPIGLFTGHSTFDRYLSVRKSRNDPLCPAWGEEEKKPYLFLGTCHRMQDSFFSIFVSHLLKLRKTKPVTLIRCRRTSKRLLWMRGDLGNVWRGAVLPPQHFVHNFSYRNAYCGAFSSPTTYIFGQKCYVPLPRLLSFYAYDFDRLS